MANIIPFRAIRPHRTKVSLVGSRSYITYSDKDFKIKLASNPYSFLHVITPTFKIKEKDNKTMGERYKEVKSRFAHFRDHGIFIRDDQPKYYVYEQIKPNGQSHIGIIAGVAIADLAQGIIKKHENTLTKREILFSNYLRETEFNAEPVLLTYTHRDDIDQVLSRYQKERPEYEFSTTDMTTHHLWVVSKEEDIAKITTSFGEISDIYIADGHHRCASSARLSADMKADKHDIDTQNIRPYNYFMAYLIADHQLHILPFHRCVKGLNKHSIPELLSQIGQSFKVDKLPKKCKPTQKHHIHMYIDDAWYRLILNPDLIDPSNSITQLDSHQLSQLILGPILGIKDIKTDSRVHFYPGDKGLKGMVKMVKKGRADIAFAMYPVEIDQLFDISDQGLIMPPKSTWIEPKLRSGLTVYSIFD